MLVWGCLRCGQACVSGRVCASVSDVRLRPGDPGCCLIWKEG